MALWTTGEDMTEVRRNREAIIGRLMLPVYDVDQALGMTLEPISVDGVAIASSVTPYYTVPASGVAVAALQRITLLNTDSVARAVTLYLVESGGSPGASNTIWADTLQPDEQVVIVGPWFLAPSDTLRAVAAAAAVVSLRAEALEFDAQPAGLTLRAITGVAIPSSADNPYTVGGSGITHALLLNTTLCNTDTVSRTPDVHIVPSGGSLAVANQVWSAALLAKETVLSDDGIVMYPGDFIRHVASAAAVIGARYSIVEFA